MRWKTDIPRFLKTRKRRELDTPSESTIDCAIEDGLSRQVTLQLTVRGDAVDISRIPNLSQSHVVEQLAQGYDPVRIAVILDTLTSESPTLWFAAVERDVRIEVGVVGPGANQTIRFPSTIGSGTIVPMRAYFDNAHLPMVSGCSLNLRLLDGSGPIRIFRRKRRFRRPLH